MGARAASEEIMVGPLACSCNLSFGFSAEKLRQLGDIDCDASRLVRSKHLG
jgi:hypothetical protein